MQAVDIAALACPGNNEIAIRLSVTESTGGLLDLLKLMGDFSLEQASDGSYSIAAPRHTLESGPWTAQGYPFFSGRGLYHCRFELPAAFEGHRIFLEPEMADDVLEVLVNGRPACGSGNPMGWRSRSYCSRAKIPWECGLPTRW